MVWTEGFEPPTACSQNRHATKLHYAQIWHPHKDSNLEFIVRSDTVSPLAYEGIWLLEKDLHLHLQPYESCVPLFELPSINGASNRS